jgi:dipeptidyl aminopeptidase/acylaminoacyl peptidase
LFYVRKADRYGVYLGSLDGQPPTPILERAPFNAIASSGYLLTMRDGTLLAYPFDEKHGRLTGEPIRVAEQVSGSSAQFASFSVSAAGALAYSTGLTTQSRLEWFDRTGKSLGPATDAGDYSYFRISPDQKQVAIARVDPQTSTSDLWLLDLSRGVATRFTTDPGTETSPVWSPDGARLVYRSDRNGGNFLFEKPVNQAVPDRLLAAFDAPFPTDWSPDGRFIAFHGPVPGGTYDVMAADLQDTSKRIPIADSPPGTDIGGQFSPDGHWLAYASDVSDRMEIYVQAFPKSGRVVQISTGGGSEPHWRRDGREIYYLSLDRKMMAVLVTPGASLVSGTPRGLFQTRAPTLATPYRMNYDVTADGSRFLITTPVEGTRTEASINVVLNWLADVRKK